MNVDDRAAFGQVLTDTPTTGNGVVRELNVKEFLTFWKGPNRRIILK